ncbi:MAG TPA: hypothetical protein VK420_12210, partial [Longimicrobium sp.]|nr:hypothetical protein [Longimicrobium sp.]
YADAGCTQPLSGLTLPASRMEGTFYFRGTQAQALTFTANAAGFASATQGANILPAPPRALVFTTPPQTLQAGACSDEVELELRDAFGNAANAAGPTVLGLGPNPAQGLTFYADAGCTQPVTGVNLVTGARGGGFYVLGTLAGALQLSAAGNGLTAADLAHTLTPAAARALAFVTPPWTVGAGTCSGALTVEARDTYGNASAVGASTAIDLSGTPATGLTFYTDPGCTTVATTLTVPQGASSGSFYFVGTSAGTFTLTTRSPGLGNVSQAQTVVAGAPGRLAFTTAPQSVQAGSCSGAAVLRTEDANGNPSPNPTAMQINLAPSAPNGFAFYADPGCTTPVTQLSVAPGAGRGTFYFRGTVAQTVTVSAFASGVAGTSQAETITAAPASALAFDSAPQTVTVGSCSAAATVGLRDGYGNPSPPAQAVAVSLVATPSTGFALYADPGCTTPLSQLTLPAGGGASFYFLGTRAGDVTLGASAAGFGNASQVQTLRPLPPSRLAFLSAPQTIQAGECSSEAVVQVQDAYGNPTSVASGAAVGLSALPSSGFAFYL